MSEYKGFERRKHPRAYRPFIVAYKKSGDDKSEGKVIQIRNISEGGFAFHSEEEFDLEESLDLLIRLPLAKEAIKAKGEVIGCCQLSKDLFCEIRVKFSEISEEAKQQIKNAVKYVLSEKRK